MALVPKTRLGPYEIVAPIGSGGMGEVYRARDTRLDRAVAVKIITANGAVHPELRTRFEREARAISSLNHPNICVLHDIGRERPLLATSGSASGSEPTAQDTPLDFLVMEYLEGESLADHLARRRDHRTTGDTPLMTVGEVVAVAIQIASALDAAHRNGVVHRDLKPANIMLAKGTQGGPPDRTPASNVQVKLMDFGIARLTRLDTPTAGDGGEEMKSVAELAMPTISAPLTSAGAILGTLYYMSPEQLEGKHVDGRSDIFAFGVVLYEMLAGRRPFAGDSQASVISAILARDPPPVASLQPLTPPLLAELVARCLAKDPDRRWQSVRDLMWQLEWIGSHNDAAASTATQSQAESRRTNPRLLLTSAIVVATALIAAGGVAWRLWPLTPPPPVISRFTFPLPDGQRFTGREAHLVALSPDGSRLVYVANEQLYLRNLHELTAAPIPGTEGSAATEPFFSPDGQWVAFHTRRIVKNGVGGALMKVPVTGGVPMLLAEVREPAGATWENGRILLGQHTPPAIVEIPENGGAAKQLVVLKAEAGERVMSPQLVAGGRAVLYTLLTRASESDDASIVVEHLTTRHRSVLLKGSDARVLPTGHLVFTRAGTIFAVPFDETRLMVTGGAVPVQSRVETNQISGTSQVAFSASGTLAIAHGLGGSGVVSTFFWVGRDGKAERTSFLPRNYGVGPSELRASPDGVRVAVTVFSDDVLNLGGGMASEVWTGDIRRGSLTKLSTTGQATSPVWSPTGDRVCYDSAGEVFCQASDGASPARTGVKVNGLLNVRPFGPDGSIFLETHGAQTGDDITLATFGPPFATRPLLNRMYSESAPAISPDGRWLAYVSDESGRTEVYVRPFPDVDSQLVPISIGGGNEPRWAHSGGELFYTVRTGGWRAPGVLMSVTIQPGTPFRAGQPAVVLKIPAATSVGYDVGRDGRFLFHMERGRPAGEEPLPQDIVVVQNWTEELKRLVPTR